MSESDKDNSEVYLRLAEHASQRYEALRNVEWKVDLGLWGFLIGANALIIKASCYSPSCFVSAVVTFLVIMLFVLHVVWFQYIHEVQQRNNRTSYWWECKARMAAGEKHNELPKECRPHANWESPTGFSQEEVQPNSELKKDQSVAKPGPGGKWLAMLVMLLAKTAGLPLTLAQWLVALPRRVTKWLANMFDVHESHIMRLVVTLGFVLLLILVLWDHH